jgi:hypothetical protein
VQVPEGGLACRRSNSLLLLPSSSHFCCGVSSVTS